MKQRYSRLARFRDAEAFQEYINGLCIHLPFDSDLLSGDEGPLTQPFNLLNGRCIGNRFCILPMEGWDGTRDGKPTEKTYRRWKNFGLSGAKLIWGGEAVAVRHDGRANPNQLMITNDTKGELEKLRRSLVEEHIAYHGSQDGLLVGLQLTHSGRFSRPNEKTRLEPHIAYHHPLVDQLFDLPEDYPLLTDGEIEGLIGDFVSAAQMARDIGFDFVDIKHCHGYLAHELLSARTRDGRYGGSYENRTRFLREVVGGIRRECPDFLLGVRLSAFDFVPFKEGPDGQAYPLEYKDDCGQYPFAFGGDPDDPLSINLDETISFLSLLKSLRIQLVCLSAGSPYYNPHIGRPAYFPPSDGYPPPEDPLVGVARQINAVAELKKHFPELALVGSAYTYLQEWLPHVAQYVVRTGMADFIGLGRMILSYPEFPNDVLKGRSLDRKRICRTFSDCTTAPRNGLVSGCYPLDSYYKELPEAIKLKQFKSDNRT